DRFRPVVRVAPGVDANDVVLLPAGGPAALVDADGTRHELSSPVTVVGVSFAADVRVADGGSAQAVLLHRAAGWTVAAVPGGPPRSPPGRCRRRTGASCSATRCSTSGTRSWPTPRCWSRPGCRI